MAHVSHRLSNSFQGALAGGGDPATSPLYVFGPFLRLIVIGGVAEVTFGASIWLVILTVVLVSAMYRQVMSWVTDGSGGSGLSEAEFGGWGVKLSAGITFVEYTLTFLVSMAALVTLTADRYPLLNGHFLGWSNRTLLAVLLSGLTGWLVNRGPKTAARAFGPATFAVIMLLWAMVVATIWKTGFHLPDFNFRALTPQYLNFTFGGYARLLALMTGIEIFANLVAAYGGTPKQKSRKAFASLAIIMGTTCITILIVGPAILKLANPIDERVSVFTQAMDQLLPAPLAYLGTVIGIIVLASASAASAQGLQNLALGLRYRHYIPAGLGQRNRFDVADQPVWVEVGVVIFCFLVFGSSEETYLAIYAAGVFILLSMTGWAATKRLTRELRGNFSAWRLTGLAGTIVAALLTSGATVIIFVERFTEGVWAYFLFLPILFFIFTYFRSRLGAPVALEDHLGRLLVGQYLLPSQREGTNPNEQIFQDIVVPLNGSAVAESALPMAELLCRAFDCDLSLLSAETSGKPVEISATGSSTALHASLKAYLEHTAWQIAQSGLRVKFAAAAGPPEKVIAALARDVGADLMVMTTHGESGVQRFFLSASADKIIRTSPAPVLIIRPTVEWRSRRTQFKKILVSLDGSRHAECVLRYAQVLAGKFEGEILLLSVPEADYEEARLKGYLKKVSEALRARGLTVHTQVTGSGPARTIVGVAESEGADLILLAKHGRGGLRRRVSMGSVTDRVIQITQCPVLLVPAAR